MAGGYFKDTGLPGSPSAAKEMSSPCTEFRSAPTAESLTARLHNPADIAFDENPFFDHNELTQPPPKIPDSTVGRDKYDALVSAPISKPVDNFSGSGMIQVEPQVEMISGRREIAPLGAFMSGQDSSLTAKRADQAAVYEGVKVSTPSEAPRSNFEA